MLRLTWKEALLIVSLSSFLLSHTTSLFNLISIAYIYMQFLSKSAELRLRRVLFSGRI